MKRLAMALLFAAFMFGPALLVAAHALGWLKGAMRR